MGTCERIPANLTAGLSRNKHLTQSIDVARQHGHRGVKLKSLNLSYSSDENPLSEGDIIVPAQGEKESAPF